MNISRIGELKKVPVGSVVKDSKGHYFRKDEFKWVFSTEKGEDCPNTDNQTENISFPAEIIPQYSQDEMIDILERENKNLFNLVKGLEKEVKDLKARVALLETPKFDRWTSPNTKPHPPYQIFNNFLENPEAAAKKVLDVLEKSAEGLKKK